MKYLSNKNILYYLIAAEICDYYLYVGERKESGMLALLLGLIVIIKLEFKIEK